LPISPSSVVPACAARFATMRTVAAPWRCCVPYRISGRPDSHAPRYPSGAGQPSGPKGENMKTIAGAAAAAGLMLCAHGVPAQEAFPSRLLTVVNPNAPGGTADIITRGMTEPLQRALKQTVITVNRPGAGGAVGGEAVAKGAADGY